MPQRLAKPMRMDMMGMVSPRPVRDRWPGRRPKYIRSTTLYRTLMSWASVMGAAKVRMVLGMLPLEKSFCCCAVPASPPCDLK